MLGDLLTKNLFCIHNKFIFVMNQNKFKMKAHSQKLKSLLKIDFPLIMAPMFLVSNFEMVSEGIKNGIMATFPSLNYRNDGELDSVLKKLKSIEGSGNYGVNLIVQETNPLYRKHLEICLENEVPFFITSLGNPKEVIEKAHSYGGKVFCDVTNLKHAEKVKSLGADGFIAVGAGAGGHAGPVALHVMVEKLSALYPDMPILAAGGISTGKAMKAMETLGAWGCSVGTRFIATKEATVQDAYKQAIVDYGMNDIIMTEKISGTPCAVIATPYAKKIGTEQGWLERKLNKSKRLKKYFKMLTQYRGMKKLQKAVKPGNYNNLWSAGQSVAMIDSILSVGDIVKKFKQEFEEA